MDAELQEVFNFAISRGVTLFDTADSYGVPLTVHPAVEAILLICIPPMRGSIARSCRPTSSSLGDLGLPEC